MIESAMPESDALTNFTHTFFGYGNLHAPVWFIGMEEGGGKSREEIEARLRSWNAAGRPHVVDIVQFGKEAGLEGHLQWFDDEKPPLQTTWKQLIRIVLSSRQEPGDASAVRAYQRDVFAREDGHECLLELLPLPSPNVGEWRYGEWYDLSWLRDRDSYREHLLDHRIERLQHLIAEHHPKAVVFYSKSYLDEWRRVMGVEPDELDERVIVKRGDRELTAFVYETDETRFVVASHPSAFGMTNSYWEGVGEMLRR